MKIKVIHSVELSSICCPINFEQNLSVNVWTQTSIKSVLNKMAWLEFSSLNIGSMK